jgi:hypothetical protein
MKFQVFLTLAAIATAQRPPGLPAGLGCSNPSGAPFDIDVANAFSATVNYFRLNEACQEQPIDSLPSGQKKVLSVRIGDGLYARILNGSCIDTRSVSGPDFKLWLIQENIAIGSIPLEPSLPSPTNSIVPSGDVKPGQQVSSGPSAGLIAGIVIAAIISLLLILTAVILFRKRKLRSTAGDKLMINIEAPTLNRQLAKNTAHQVNSCYLIVAPHDANLEDEISVVVGDIVLIHAIYDDGWANASIKQASSINSKLELSRTRTKNQYKKDAVGRHGMLPITCFGPLVNV